MTSVHALQLLEEKDLQKLKCQVQHSWEKRALEKLLNLSHSNTLSELQESWVESLKKRKMEAEQALQEQREMLSEQRQQQEEAVRKKEVVLRQTMEIPKEFCPAPEKP